MFRPSRHCRKVLTAALVVMALLTLGAGQSAAQSVSVEPRRDLLFGRVGTGDIPGSVTVSAAGVKTTTGGVVDMGKNTRAAQFRISGPRDATVYITLPTTATISGGGRTATLSHFTMDVTNPVTLPRTGRLNFNVGATLTLGTNLPAAEYTGNFDVYVDLQ